MYFFVFCISVCKSPSWSLLSGESWVPANQANLQSGGLPSQDKPSQDDDDDDEDDEDDEDDDDDEAPPKDKDEV